MILMLKKKIEFESGVNQIAPIYLHRTRHASNWSTKAPNCLVIGGLLLVALKFAPTLYPSLSLYHYILFLSPLPEKNPTPNCTLKSSHALPFWSLPLHSPSPLWSTTIRPHSVTSIQRQGRTTWCLTTNRCVSMSWCRDEKWITGCIWLRMLPAGSLWNSLLFVA